MNHQDLCVFVMSQLPIVRLATHLKRFGFLKSVRVLLFHWEIVSQSGEAQSLLSSDWFAHSLPELQR